MQALVDWVIGWTNQGQFAILLFPVIVGALIFTASRLVAYSEAIIARTKFGGGFIGGTLVAAVTSMPELITEVTQGSVGHPENGTGDNVGSNAFNTLLIGVGAILFTRYLFLNKLPRWTKVTLGLSFGINAALGIFLGLNRFLGFADIAGSYVGIVPAFFFVFYLITIGLYYKYGDHDQISEALITRRGSLRFILFGLAFWSAALVAVAVILNADVNAFQYGLNIPTESVGGLFLAITTSAPEIVAFFAFMRRGQPAAAVASIAGSHFFNLGIAFFGDLAYTPGPSFNNKDMGKHWPTALMAAGLLFLIMLHIVLARRFPRAFAKKSVYLIVPSVMVSAYVVGWAMILTFNAR